MEENGQVYKEENGDGWQGMKRRTEMRKTRGGRARNEVICKR